MTIHVHDAGTLLGYIVRDKDTHEIIPIPDTAVITFRLMPKGRPSFERPGRLLTDGLDGKVVYATQEDDLIYPKSWSYQAHVDLGNGQAWWLDAVAFEVVDNLPDPPAP